MSWHHIRLSNGSDAFIARSTVPGASSKRPPQIELEEPLRALIVLLLAVGACDRQSPDAPQGNATTFTPALATGAEQAGKVDIAQRGTVMPGEAFVAPDGAPTTLAAFKGKPLLVNLWATWCGPCVKEMPSLDRLSARAGSKLKVLTVSQDRKGKDAVGPWWTARSFTRLEPYLDPDMNLGFALGGGMLPTTVLYDAQGKEVWRVTGGIDWDGPRASMLLADVLTSGTAS